MNTRVCAGWQRRHCAIAGLALAIGSFYLAGWLEKVPDIASVTALVHLLPHIALLMGGGLLCGGLLLSLQRGGPGHCGDWYVAG